MRYNWMLCFVLGISAAAYAGEPKVYETGSILQMDSVPCAGSKTPDALCQEYVVQGERVIYHIRPRDQKHAAILPVGDRAQYRMAKDKMLLRMEDFTGKEREYSVVSVSPRASNSADATPVHLNHLQ